MPNAPKIHLFDKTIPTILLLCAFGPLLSTGMGIRMDQVMLYGLFPIAFGMICVGRESLVADKYIFIIISILSVMTLWTIVVTVGGVPDHVFPSSRTTEEELAGFENYFHTIALVFVLAVSVKKNIGYVNEQLLVKMGYILIILMCINAFIALSSAMFGVLPFLQYFVSADLGAGESRFEITAEGGRFTGIFDVPATAGAAYSLALLMWAYINRRSQRHSIVNYMLGGVLIVGGTITISKIFIFGGIPLFFIYWMWPGRANARFTIKLLLVLTAIVVSVVVFSELWVGLGVIDDLFISNRNTTPFELFFHFLKIRYGTTEEAVIGGIFNYIWDTAPVSGLGFSYYGVADSAYLLYFMEGGMVSLALYLGLIISLIYIGLENWYRGHEIGRFLTILGVFILIAGVGAPIITMARTDTILWIMVILALGVRNEKNSLRSQKNTSREGSYLCKT